jgi:hypothetical protein
LATGDYIELKDGSLGIGIAVGTYTTPVAVERPANVHIYSGDRHHVHTHACADPAVHRYGQGLGKKRGHDTWMDDDNESSELGSPERRERNERSAPGDGRAESDRSSEAGLHRSQTGIVKTVEIKQSYV